MKKLVLILTVALFGLFSTSCTVLDAVTKKNLSQTETQAKLASEQAQIMAIQAGQIQKLLSSAVHNIDKGFRFQDQGKDVARLPDGTPIMVKVPGTDLEVPIWAEWSSEFSLSSYVDLADNIEGLQLDVGKIVEAAGVNQAFSSVPKRNGLSLTILKAGGSMTNADAIAALKSGQAADKKAAGDAVTAAIQAEWAGKADLLGKSVVVIDQLGRTAVGVLEALNPVSKAVAEVSLRVGDVIQKMDVKSVELADPNE